MASIKKNFVYSSILTISTYIFPLIVFPYVSRVLGVEKIGACNFVDSIINYFIIFANLGMNSIAIREIAMENKDRNRLSQVFSNLLSLNLITTLSAIVVLCVSILLIPKFQAYKPLLYIGVAKLLFNSLLIEWFYKGIESFKYITIRTILIKCIYVISIFLFIDSPDDYIIYFLINVLVFVINATINIFHVHKFVNFYFPNASMKKLVAPFFILGAYQILTSMYTTFNVAYLGFVHGDFEVGCYTTATKLYTVILGILTSFTGVMLPRMSSIVAEGNMVKFKEMISKSIDVLLFFACPLVVVGIVFAPQMINIMAGEGYENAILPMRIIMPLLLVIGYEQILVIQTLMPLKKDKALFVNSCLGAVVGVSINILLVKEMAYIGSAISWIMSEFTVLISAQYFVSKYLEISFPVKKYTYNILCLAPLISILFIISVALDINGYLKLCMAGILTLVYYIIVDVFLIRNSIAIEIVDMMKHKLKKYVK